jgi:serine/threonine-protein kinase RsbW
MITMVDAGAFSPGVGGASTELMNQLRSSPPPDGAVELQQWLLASGDELRQLRADLHQALHAHGLAGAGAGSETPERVVLVASELVSNALRHGRPPAVVRLLRADGHVILEVADRDPGGVPRLIDPGPLDAQQADGGGRGLQIASSLALEVGWYATAAAKHVWASFPLAAPGQ